MDIVQQQLSSHKIIFMVMFILIHSYKIYIIALLNVYVLKDLTLAGLGKSSCLSVLDVRT